MTIDKGLHERLVFLVRVVMKEKRHLEITDERVFNDNFTQQSVLNLEQDIELGERLDAFVSRFGRLQDTVGDKLLPTLLSALGEKPGPAIDNLDKAEKMGFIGSVDQWLTIRKLRNQMIHEYVEDPVVLFSALKAGHSHVTTLIKAAQNMADEIAKRGWAGDS